MALIALQTSIGNTIPKMTVIERIEGPSHPEELISQIDIAIERQGAVVNRLKSERSQRESERQLLKDQDAAYHQSLKADQEKARIAKVEEDALARAKEEAENEKKQIELLKEKQRQYIQYLYTQLPEEPTDSICAKLSFRLSDGDRVVRKFKPDATIDVSYLCHIYLCI
jgi:FAS-associated factor 2